MTEVLTAPGSGASHFASGLHRAGSHSRFSLDSPHHYGHSDPSKASFRHSEYGLDTSTSAPSSAPSSPQLPHTTFSSTTSYNSTPASSLSLDTKSDMEDEEDIVFPMYDGESGEFGRASEGEDKESITAYDPQSKSVRRRGVGSSEIGHTAADDQTIENEPTRHVDYLSHEWKEEDIWSSWRYIVARRNVYSNSVRLENASWRTWAKAKNNLRTVSPETLNWLKDCDVTWLYGPLQTDSKKSLTLSVSPPPSRLSTSSSFLHKKPILKKKSASEAILQRSISSHSLLKHASAILQAQEAIPAKARPSFGRAASDFVVGSVPVGSSGRMSVVNTPVGEESYSSTSLRYSITSSGMQSPGGKRHIHFNNEVVQCIALDMKDEDEEELHNTPTDEEDDEDEGIVMMKQVPSKARASNRSTPRGSFSNESKTIALLPSTTLKYRGDTPEPNELQQQHGPNAFWPLDKKLSPSPSQETLRPTKPGANFLIDDDDEDPDVQWGPAPTSYTGTLQHSSSSYQSDPNADDEYDPGPGMRRTPSGMFMPYDEDEEESAMNMGLFGRVVDTVNTARDIAHVIWNVGWRR